MSELFSQAEVERFWWKVDKSGSGGCWIWTACIDGRGYGSFSAAGKRQRAHRVAYELARGEPPAGLVLDHLCRVKTCVNPDHLEAVPQRVNVLRGDSHVARQARQTHCIHGHEFNEENTRYSVAGRRICRACIRRDRTEAQRRYRARKHVTYLRAEQERQRHA